MRYAVYYAACSFIFKRSSEKVKNVILFTDEYPYGFGEEYLTPEIELLCKKCNLTVITLQSDKPRKKLIDVKIPIYRINRDISRLSKSKKFKYLVKCVTKKYFGVNYMIS